jgi:hypothetical protein
MRSDYASLFRLVITRHGAPVVSDEASQAMALVSRDLIGTPTFHPDPPRAAIFFGREDWRYPLFQSLPETPSYHLPRPLLRPTVMTALEAVEAPDFALTPEAIKPVKVYIFAPDQ